MKFMLMVHHDEKAFNKIEKEKRQQMLAESVELTHQLHAAGHYLSASPLHRGRDRDHRAGARGQTARDRWTVYRNARADCRLLPGECTES
jgi:hypothetical protein